MYRLLIVDDEAIIADGLYDVFQSLKTLDLDVYKAYSGMEAIELLNRTRIDIVLSDIRMPGMDGLQLLEQIHRRWPKCRVIFLTGYNEFDYVYTAIQYEGVNYILKTEGYDKVISTVQNTVLDIERNFKQETLLQEAEKQLVTARELLRGNFLNAVLKGRLFKQEINTQQFEELGISLNAEEDVIMLIGRIDDLPRGLPYSERSRRLYSISITAEKYLSDYIRFVHFHDESSLLIWLIQPGSDMRNEQSAIWEKCITFVKGNLELIQIACMESMKLSVSLALDDAPSKWIELQDRFATLKMVINYRFGQESAMLLADRSVIGQGLKSSQEKANETLSTNRHQFEVLAETLEYGKREDFFALLSELTNELRSTQSMHNIVAHEQYSSIALILLSYINRWNALEKVAFRIGIHKLMRTEEHSTWNDAVEYLHQLSNILFDIQDQEQEKRAQDVIGTIQKHINDHIHIQDEITLVRLADLVHFNPSYLSRLFKQVVGMNLSDYISEIRIKKAKLLLDNPEMKINAVAEALGYGTATNFTRFFKKVTNMTPQEYREFHHS